MGLGSRWQASKADKDLLADFVVSQTGRLRDRMPVESIY
jgi:hypothetical protein